MTTIKNNKRLIISSLIAVAIVAAVNATGGSVNAATQTQNTTINANVSEALTISAAGAVNIGVIPTPAGAISTQSHAVTVNTNNAGGYVLTLATSTADTTLKKGADTIAASAGTQAAPTALAANTWGYRVDGLGGFATGGAIVSNVASTAQTFAGVPATSAPNTIKTTAVPATGGDTTTVYYGVNVNSSRPSGTYTNTVVYTATTN